MSTSLPPRVKKDVSSEASAHGGGRVVPSRYMNATASSRAATSKPSTAQQKPFSSTLGPAKTGPAASTRAKYPASSTTKPRAVVPSKSSSLSNSRAARPPSRPATNESSGAGSASTFELEAASQLYPWLFMRHTLAEASDAATRKAQAILATRAKELEAEEAALADDRVRYQAEREIQLLDELSHESVCRVAPSLVQEFMRSEEECRKAILHASHISNARHDWSLPDVRTRLQHLDLLGQESTVLHDSIAELAITAPADSLLAFTWSGLLRSLDGRLENLRLSKELLVRTRENFIKACHLESLEIEGFS